MYNILTHILLFYSPVSVSSSPFSTSKLPEDHAVAGIILQTSYILSSWVEINLIKIFIISYLSQKKIIISIGFK